ncbi:MAG: hypothetical protein GTO45_07765 [Candidatus Aminicenantes bacterium]|nr:hypothetical protein [Candidatus Aminicenantes bacterium]NIM80664.1 hypothetical protein [Candidatus Aminicenantes bacterium]NIN17981.1 hypothetical protein [Candidatus Aminicenantes bacterium]NIN41881.1 hypothetical protein [Candidatus Aminicenantes bacterium]NIN84636.1 hypothetical protein [Candidatus Aminicenantes bacterium]
MTNKKIKYPDSFNKAPLEKKVEMIFEWMGYDVEWNRCFQSYQVDIFVKKKDDLCDDFEYWLCIICHGDSKLEMDVVSTLVKTRTIAREELKTSKYDCVDCQGMIISENESSFSREAILEANLHNIELMTLKKLLDAHERFMKEKERLIRHIESLEKEYKK